MDFLPLHVYTGYSVLKSGMSMDRYVALAKKRGQSHAAVSDFQTMTGFPELSKLCAEAGMVPVYAMDVKVERFLLTLLVQSEEGYLNLIKIGLLASKRNLTLDDLKGHSQGLAFIVDLSPSWLIEKSEQGNDAFQETLRPLDKAFGIMLGLPYLPSRLEYRSFLRNFIHKYPYTTLAFPHIRYPKKDDAISLAIVEAIDSDSSLEQKTMSGDQWYLDEETLTSYYSPEELAAPLKLVESCHFDYAKKRGELPTFPSTDGLSPAAALRKASFDGLSKKKPDHGEEYVARLNYELGVIGDMGYDDYFLIVADYVDYAKSHGISVGPGRGSAAGSLVAYCLDIITTDPLEFGLLFERFLNPERQTMPDIDVDFADTRRNEVVYYLQEKYGHDRVAHIVAMQTLGAKASIRDIGRVFGYEPRHIDMLAKAIGKNDDSLRENYKHNKEFRDLVDSDPYYLEIVSLAAKVEGLPRQPGLHAAGIVLSQKPLEDVVPVAENSGVGMVAQYDMTHLEEQGVLKMDLLGIRHLTVIDHCLELVEKTQGVHLDYAKIPYDDPKAIELIASGKTIGLFQLKSEGMRRAISLVHPTTFSDVVAVIALFRPGPMVNIPSFAKRKAGKEKIVYPSPLLEPYLKETYGIIVYQEQIMQIARAMAGFSYAQADVFRAAVSKKNAAKLASLRGDFFEGCRKNGIDEKTIEDVFDLIYRFADYGFNKSHALAYAVLACQMAYLKAHYPLEFYCATLDDTSSSDPTFSALVSEIKNSGYRFRLPSVNLASTRFIPSGGAITFPLTSIKSMQGMLAVRIIEERELHGPYKDYFDFALRNKANGLTTNSLVRLVDAGCFDDFGLSRARLRLGADLAIGYAETFAGTSGNEALLNLNFPRPEIPNVESDPLDDLLHEKEALGMMISGSPLDSKADVIAKEGLLRLSTLLETGREGTYAGVVLSSKSIVTKKGQKMAFLTLYDEESVVEVTLFAETYLTAYPLLKEGTLVKVKIRKNYGRDGFTALAVESL